MKFSSMFTAKDVMDKFNPLNERIFITGCHGLLGGKLHQLLGSTNHIIGADLSPDTHLTGPQVLYRSLDITRRDEVIALIDELKPGFIVNTAALTGVDLCEKERDKCWRVNVLAVEHLMRAAKRVGSHLIQISSDYVFDGKNAPYSETDATNPLGFYGKSKLAAENILRGEDVNSTIVRTQVLYGVVPKTRPNFVDFIREKLKGRGDFSIVDDQIGTPTLVDDLAEGISRIIQLRKEGIYHISGREPISRYDFARKIAFQFGEDPNRIKPTKTSDLKQLAPRPANSSFCLDKISRELMLHPHGIDEGLQVYKQQLNEYQAALKGNL